MGEFCSRALQIFGSVGIVKICRVYSYTATASNFAMSVHMYLYCISLALIILPFSLYILDTAYPRPRLSD